MRSCPNRESVHVSSDEIEGEVKAANAASHNLVKKRNSEALLTTS